MKFNTEKDWNKKANVKRRKRMGLPWKRRRRRFKEEIPTYDSTLNWSFSPAMEEIAGDRMRMRERDSHRKIERERERERDFFSIFFLLLFFLGKIVIIIKCDCDQSDNVRQKRKGCSGGYINIIIYFFTF